MRAALVLPECAELYILIFNKKHPKIMGKQEIDDPIDSIFSSAMIFGRYRLFSSSDIQSTGKDVKFYAYRFKYRNDMI